MQFPNKEKAVAERMPRSLAVSLCGLRGGMKIYHKEKSDESK